MESQHALGWKGPQKPFNSTPCHQQGELPLSPIQPHPGYFQGRRAHIPSPAHLPSRPPCFCLHSFVSRAISPTLGTPPMEDRAAPVGNVVFWSTHPRSSPWGRQQNVVLGKVLRGFHLFHDKSSAGNLEDPFILSFFLPPGELADIFGVKFVLKYAQCSGGTVSILSCLLKNVIAWLMFSLSLFLFFAPKSERNRSSLKQPPLEL